MNEAAQPWQKCVQVGDRRFDYDNDDQFFIGDVRLTSILPRHRHFDVKNAEGNVVVGCRIEFRGELKNYSGTACNPQRVVKLVARTPGGWTLMLDGTMQFRRTEGSAEAEAETRARKAKAV
jgi:hypothetical protein